ncbi:hypothetical protein ACHAW6_002252 [Cyclotella cf. meneghiniana]
MGTTERPPSPFSKRQNSTCENDTHDPKSFYIGCLSHAPTTHDDEQPSHQHPLHRPSLRGPSHSTNLVHSLSRLSRSRRLSVTCSGSDLGQLYLSSPEQDAVDFLTFNARTRSIKRKGDGSKTLNDSWGNLSVETSSTADSDEVELPHSWVDAVDLYGRRKSFSCRRNSYVRFLDVGVVDKEEVSFLIEETQDDTKLRNSKVWWRSPSLVVPFLMLLDLTLGISLSLYDSNLLRNVPDFHFPLCYAWIQKFTNALASLVLICLSRRWGNAEQERSRQQKAAQLVSITEEQLLTEMPSMRVFRRNAIPLTAIAIVQTISAAFANRSLQILPLPLFKVVLMCGPIFVAFLTSAIEGNIYSRGRIMALSLIGLGALRAVYADAEGADNPRGVMEGAAYALGASALSGMGLVISGVLMHGDPAEEETESEIKEEELNPLSLLFYLSCEQVAMLSFYLCPWETLWSENSFQAANDGSSEFVEFIIYSCQNPHKAIIYLMLGSTISFCLAILTFTLVTRTSPVAASLLGNVRSIGTVAVSSFIWGGIDNRGMQTSLFGSAALGYVMTLAGGVMYALSPASTTAKST